MKDYDRAIADSTQAIQLDPGYVLAFNTRGLAFHQKKEYDRAIADFTEAIRLDLSQAFLFHNRSLAFYAKKETDRAMADCSEAVRLDPEICRPLPRALMPLYKSGKSVPFPA